MPAYFITATGTDVGKTFVMASLCHQLSNLGKKVYPLKSVISGWNEESMDSTDTVIMMNAAGIEINKKSISQVSPLRFLAPLSPDMAARKENKSVTLDMVVSHCKEAAESYVGEDEYVLAEGVGGIMVPLNEKHTVLNWIEVLNWPTIVVAGNYLGSINHTLMTLEILAQRKVKISALVVSESENAAVSLEEQVKTLRSFVSVPIVMLPRAVGKIQGGANAGWYNSANLLECVSL